ncbi:unannotated protein [freshwater metagenome]|uniref:Unannotated protein n=1 Tax=freshwater metagenome TaxID=449393 RepID=A0A6J6WJ75_9ZZZZ
MRFEFAAGILRGCRLASLVIEPSSDLAPVDVQFLLAMGVPAEAILNGTRLDLAMLEDLGWIVEPGSVSPPLD